MMSEEEIQDLEAHKDRYHPVDPNCRFCKGLAWVCSVCHAFDLRELRAAREIRRLQAIIIGIR